MWARVALSVVGVLCGGWMIFDGLHVLVRGKYFGPPRPGPWAAVVERFGVDPFRLGPLFVALGVLWLTCLVGVLAGKAWAWYAAAAVAVATLWYLPLGTVLAVVYLGLLWVVRR